MRAPRRLSTALRTWPDAAGWSRAALELAWAVPAVMIVTALAGALRFEPQTDPGAVALTLAVLLVTPALGEELLFRVLVLPDRPSTSDGRRAALSVALFVAWHPFQAFTFGPPWAALFLEPWFLLATALLGIALARIYLTTRSLWPCVFAHWLVVAGWKLIFGGPFG